MKNEERLAGKKQTQLQKQEALQYILQDAAVNVIDIDGNLNKLGSSFIHIF